MKISEYDSRSMLAGDKVEFSTKYRGIEQITHAEIVEVFETNVIVKTNESTIEYVTTIDKVRFVSRPSECKEISLNLKQPDEHKKKKKSNQSDPKITRKRKRSEQEEPVEMRRSQRLVKPRRSKRLTA